MERTSDAQAAPVDTNAQQLDELSLRVVRSIRDRLVLAGLDATALDSQSEPIRSVVHNGLSEVENAMRDAAAQALCEVASIAANSASVAVRQRIQFRLVAVDPIAQAVNRAARANGSRGPLVAPSTK